MARYLLDTNIVSHLIRNHPLVDRRAAAVPRAALCVSVIIEAELLFGLTQVPQSIRLGQSVQYFLSGVEVLDWTRACAARHAKLRAELRREGMRLSPLDMLIAAHALTLDTTLVTADRAFHEVPGLRWEDWTVA